MPLSLADLEKGYDFPPATFELSPEWVNAYVAAAQDESSHGAVPPMAVAALSVRALLENAALPPGSIHAAQELAFHGPVQVGDTVSASARVVSRGERAGWVLMGFALESSANGRQLMTGRATLTFPLGGSA